MMNGIKAAFKAKNFSEALRLSLELHQQRPDDLIALEYVAKSYYGLKKFTEAIDVCDQALTIETKIAWPHIVKSYILFLKKKWESCKVEAQTAIEISPEDWETNFWWGSVLGRENKHKESTHYLEKAVMLETEEWALYNNLATSYFKIKEYKKYYWSLAEMDRLKPSLFISILIAYGRLVGLDKK